MPSLVESLRPHSVDQVLGQDHLLGPATSLRRFCSSSNFSSFCLSGPSGSGKTSIARAIANLVSCPFVSLSISGTNFSQVGDLLEKARQNNRYGCRPLILIKYFFMLSREEQHVFLPYVESRDVVLCVTENNLGTVMVPELLAFFTMFTTIKLEPCHLEKIINAGLGKMGEGRLWQIKIEKNGRDFLVSASNGDANIVLNVLEAAASGAIDKHDMHSSTGKRKPGKGLMDTLRDMASGDFQRRLKSGVESSDESEPSTGKSKSELDLAKRDFLMPQAPAQIQQDITVTLSSIQEALEKQNKTEDPDNKVAFALRKSMHEFKDILGEMASGDYQGLLKSGIEICDESKPLRRRKCKRKLDLSNSDCSIAPQALPNRDCSIVSQAQTQTQIQQDTLASTQEALYSFRIACIEDQNKTEDPKDKLASTLRKSMCESDLNAAIYWLARLLEDGMPPLQLAKCLVSFASEDVGLADPRALFQAMACYSACENLDMDCSSCLALCVAYLTSAPKSNSVHQAICSARTLIRGLSMN